MEVNTFYELRSRLYAQAAAGCGLIAEDFRLKRALEAFEPMSKANKVFGRLYQMCQSLYSSEDTAQKLADCIALADALAVTQAGFLDSSECEDNQKDIALKPQTMLHSEMERLKEEILQAKGSRECREYLETKLEKVLEPRIFPTFLEGIYRQAQFSKRNWWIQKIAEDMLSKLGDGVVDLLKERVDFETTGSKNRTAYYVKLIARIYGEKETDWYIELAENETYPKSIRCAAVWALGKSEKNVSKLMELYKTQKGKIKDAVIYELARLNPPEAEEIWKKFTTKYKTSYEDFIACSKSDICAEFVRNIVCEKVKQCEENLREKGKKELSDEVEWGAIGKMMRRKYQLEDCFHLLEEKDEAIREMVPTSYLHGNWRDEWNQALIENLIEEDVRYSEMIKNLYQKHPDFYFPARFFLALKETGEQALEDYINGMHKNREQVLRMLEDIEYDPVLKGYSIPWNGLTNFDWVEEESRYRLKVSDTFPDSLLAFAAETDYIPDKRQLSDDTAIEIMITRALNILTPEKEMAEYEKCRNTLVEFALLVNCQYSIGYEIDCLAQFYQGKPEDYKGWITNYVLHNLCRNSGYSVTKIYNINTLPMKDEDKKNELLELQKKVEGVKPASKNNDKKNNFLINDKKNTLLAIKNLLETLGYK